MKSIIVVDKNKEFKIILQKVLNILGVTHVLVQNGDVNKSELYNYLVLNGLENDDILKNISQMHFDYILMNMDNDTHNSLNMYGNIITYGFGNKNTITISSVEKDSGNFVYCLQRYIQNNKCNLEPQEVPITIPFTNNNELYAYIVAITIAMVEGKDMCNIKGYLNLQKEYKNLFK
ncbi:hypothetical protein [Clostridium rectalis]|uniref:hypothetical protein n=1 Tax=Clostridium rectalis TaxID=2040295 RepID=UPI000F635517|nr:hypothetical protein [Clostridium rectalis]